MPPTRLDPSSPRLVVHTGERLADLLQVEGLPDEVRREIRVVAQVLPFKVNDYVLEELIDWSRAPDDPIYRLTFPHREMLDEASFDAVAARLDAGASKAEVRALADEIRLRLNPHPAGQLEKNVPMLDGEPVPGLQHKYRETVLFFPSQGQTCHAYCGYCFRWAQFVGMTSLKQANRDAARLTAYLRRRPEVTDLLLTGGDPMIMGTRVLERYLAPLLAPELSRVQSIRIGSKALAYWPHRFLTDRDADDLLRLLEALVRAGRHVALMAHFSHTRELETEAVERAIRRIRSTGAVIRTQAPVVRHVNDDPAVWESMWRRQVRLGLVPYYMFVERDTGARRYYEIPLWRAHQIYREARNAVSGLARTARGPSMSATPGKVVIDGVTEIAGETVYCLRFLQARNPAWAGRPFFAHFDPEARWLDDLRPAFGKERFFFETDPIQDWQQVRPPARHGRTHGTRPHHVPSGKMMRRTWRATL